MLFSFVADTQPVDPESPTVCSATYPQSSCAFPSYPHLPVCSDRLGPTVHSALLWELPSALQLTPYRPRFAKHPRNKALARTLNRTTYTHPSKTRSMVQFRLFPPALVPPPPPLSRCLFLFFLLFVLTRFRSQFWRTSIAFWNNLHRGFGLGVSQRLNLSACDLFKWSSIAFQHAALPRLPTSSCVRRHPKFTLEYKPSSGILPSSPPSLNPYTTVTITNLPARAEPWTGRRLH